MNYIIKRVVGLPGDTVSSQHGKLYVNGEPLPEAYLGAGTVADCSAFVEHCFPSTPLGPGQYFVLGDNRPSSKDSRFFGPVPRAAILGVALRITHSSQPLT